MRRSLGSIAPTKLGMFTSYFFPWTPNGMPFGTTFGFRNSLSVAGLATPAAGGPVEGIAAADVN